MVSWKDSTKGEVCINGRFFYTIKHKPMNDGHTRTESYIDGRRWLDARFCMNGYRESAGANSASPTAEI